MLRRENTHCMRRSRSLCALIWAEVEFLSSACTTHFLKTYLRVEKNINQWMCKVSFLSARPNCAWSGYNQFKRMLQVVSHCNWFGIFFKGPHAHVHHLVPCLLASASAISKCLWFFSNVHLFIHRQIFCLSQHLVRLVLIMLNCLSKSRCTAIFIRYVMWVFVTEFILAMVDCPTLSKKKLTWCRS